MAQKQKTAKMSRKVGKKAIPASVPEKKVENKSEIEILPNVNRKSKLEAEMDRRYKNLVSFISNMETGFAPLSDYEKILSMSYDCRNTARKLAKFNSPVIIA